MVSLETLKSTSKSLDPTSSPPRISFSSEFLEENNYISICPNPKSEREQDRERAPRNPDYISICPNPNKSERERERAPRNPDFDFLSGSNLITKTNMTTADELFCEGKLLPFWQMHEHIEKLNKITLKPEKNDEKQARPEKHEKKNNINEEMKISWFIDDDPSPRPPKCTVLFKELLRLKKQRANNSTLTPSSSSSSSSSRSSIGENSSSKDEQMRKNGVAESKEKAVKRIKKGLERTRSASIRIRPVINVNVCNQVKSSSLPPLFSMRKGR